MEFSIARRRSVAVLSTLSACALSGLARTSSAQQTRATVLDAVALSVLPPGGYRSRISLGKSIVELVEHGVIVPLKFARIGERSGGIPSGLPAALSAPTETPILLTTQNANAWVNLLWPLGLANYMSANVHSPISGASLASFASTSAWTLGAEPNGAAYFNRFKVVELTPIQEAEVMTVASRSYRPCCNNPTFFQDCNHGSALLGLLELGAAQGLTEQELWREALAFNSFWFASYYVQTAYYFTIVKNIDWEHVDPALVMGKDYSSGGGWSANVDGELRRRTFMRRQPDGAACGA
jgi:hypothetical protein